MLKAFGLKKSESVPANLNADKKAEAALKELYEFEVLLQAMDYVLDDRASKGTELLEKYMKENGENSSENAGFVLGLGVIEFIEATLGFEAETMKHAQSTLNEAERLSHKKKLIHERNQIVTSEIYPPGTQYAVTYAEANLLNALIMLLSESMIESAKALYKLRKAYHTLDDINKSISKRRSEFQALKTANESHTSLQSDTATDSGSSATAIGAGSATSETYLKHVPRHSLTAQQKRDIKYLRWCEKIYNLKKARANGTNIGHSPATERLRPSIGLYMDAAESAEDLSQSSDTLANTSAVGIPETLTIDEFIHSGVNLCFGILQVVLSLIPPTIGKVLSIVGFRGSRENGLEMLWSAALERNIHGGFATLALLVFYDGPFQFTDTDFDIPGTEGTILHPGKRLETALLKARAFFPNSVLWLLQEGRMLAGQGNLTEAAELMEIGTNKQIEMKQAKALLVFDRAMVLVYMHEYEEAAELLLKLIELNAWSHALYTFFAGACYVELYRMCRSQIGLETKGLKKDDMLRYKAKAVEYIEKAPTYLEGIKKGFFQSKQMPMDRYLLRKMEQYTKTRAKYPKLDIVDCMGVSLVHELSYFWNAYNRMDTPNLELSLSLLGYSGAVGSEYSLNTTEKNYSLIPESESDSMVRYLLQALVLRRLGKVEEGARLLDKNVIQNKILVFDNGSSVQSSRYIKRSEDPWVYPTAMFEMAIFCWKLKGMDGLSEVMEWLKKAMGYADDYELSARTGMRIKAAMDRLENR